MFTLFKLGLFDALPGIYKPRLVFRQAGITGYMAYHAGYKIGAKIGG